MAPSSSTDHVQGALHSQHAFARLVQPVLHGVAVGVAGASINWNDGMGGGNSITQNLMFNWVRETSDHGALLSPHAFVRLTLLPLLPLLPGVAVAIAVVTRTQRVCGRIRQFQFMGPFAVRDHEYRRG